MNNNTYTIVIRNDTEDSAAGQRVGGAGGISNNGKTDPNQSSRKNKKGKDTSKALEKIAKGYVSAAAMVSVIDKVASHTLHVVEVHTGSRELAQRTTTVYNLGKNILFSAISGATAGSVIPGVGTAVGAVVGAVASVVEYGVDLAFQQATINENKQLDNVRRNYTTQRATISGGRYMNATQM